MRYRRNTDDRLRSMEREFASTGDLQLLVPINRLRRQAGLPPHPEAIIRIANNALFEWLPNFAQSLMSAISVYDEIDIGMHIHRLRDTMEEFVGGEYNVEAPYGDPQDEGSLVEAVVQLAEDIEQLKQEYSIVSRAGVDFNISGDFSGAYENLRARHGIDPVVLGGTPELPEDQAGTVYFFSRSAREQQARPGSNAAREQIGWMLQLVSRRALRIYRKLLAYGVFSMPQVLENDPEVISEWEDSELQQLDQLADKIHLAIGAILDVTQGFGPSPETIEIFSQSWYQD